MRYLETKTFAFVSQIVSYWLTMTRLFLLTLESVQTLETFLFSLVLVPIPADSILNHQVQIQCRQSPYFRFN